MSTCFGRHRISCTTVARRIFAARALDALRERTHHARRNPKGSGTARARLGRTVPLRRSRARARWHDRGARRRALDHRREKAAVRCRELAPGGQELGDRTISSPTLRRHPLRQRFETPPDIAHVPERSAPPLEMLGRQPDDFERGFADDLEELRAASVDELGAELDRHRPCSRSARPDAAPGSLARFEDQHARSCFAELGGRGQPGRSSTHDRKSLRFHGALRSKADASFLTRCLKRSCACRRIRRHSPRAPRNASCMTRSRADRPTRRSRIRPQTTNNQGEFSMARARGGESKSGNGGQGMNRGGSSRQNQSGTGARSGNSGTKTAGGRSGSTKKK